MTDNESKKASSKHRSSETPEERAARRERKKKERVAYEHVGRMDVRATIVEVAHDKDKGAAPKNSEGSKMPTPRSTTSKSSSSSKVSGNDDQVSVQCSCASHMVVVSGHLEIQASNLPRQCCCCCYCLVRKLVICFIPRQVPIQSRFVGAGAYICTCISKQRCLKPWRIHKGLAQHYFLKRFGDWRLKVCHFW